jgi:hypothetical protein
MGTVELVPQLANSKATAKDSKKDFKLFISSRDLLFLMVQSYKQKQQLTRNHMKKGASHHSETPSINY